MAVSRPFLLVFSPFFRGYLRLDARNPASGTNGPGAGSVTVRNGRQKSGRRRSLEEWAVGRTTACWRAVVSRFSVAFRSAVVISCQLILLTAPGVSNEGGSSPLLALAPAVSRPRVPAWGSLEPPRRGGENAKKTGKNGAKMGEVWPKKCEQGRDRRDQLEGIKLTVGPVYGLPGAGLAAASAALCPAGG